MEFSREDNRPLKKKKRLVVGARQGTSFSVRRSDTHVSRRVCYVRHLMCSSFEGSLHPINCPTRQELLQQEPTRVESTREDHRLLKIAGALISRVLALNS